MRTAVVIALGAALLGSAMLSCKKAEAPASSAPSPAASPASAAKPQVYAVHGILKGFREANKVVIIDHQAIPGLMGAMTMGFELADPGLAKGLAKGDQVDAVLEVGDSSFKITGLKKVGEVNIVFFDGVCVLCNGFADLLLRLDRGQRLKFAALQGRSAKKHLGPRAKALSTLFYVRQQGRQRQVLEQSDAVLGIFQDLSYPWRMVSWFSFLPRGLRNALYLGVVRNRYRVFGRRETCRLPSPAERQRFLN